MSESLHARFDSLNKRISQSDAPSHHHPDAATILRRCEENLYGLLPTGRHLSNILNFHHIPVSVQRADKPGYSVHDYSSIVLECPDDGGKDMPLDELTIHLGCGIRIVELHIPDYISPEMKDSREWRSVHLNERFEIMLTICKLAHEIKTASPSPEIDRFLKTHNYSSIFEAYEHKQPYAHIEEIMLNSFNEIRS